MVRVRHVHHLLKVSPAFQIKLYETSLSVVLQYFISSTAMYTNLTVPSNPELSSMISTNLEYVVDHKELHNFAIQIARGMKHLQDLQITHR